VTDMSSSPGVAARVPAQSAPPVEEPTGWVGWIVFAAIMMMLVGSLHAIEGLVAIFKDTYYLVGQSGLVVSADYTVWGWVHLIFGILVAAAGVSLLSGRTWARTVGVIVAAISIWGNFGFTSAYPVWSVIVIALDILVIYALTVHGREMKNV
jgi:hypothetical protein